MPTPLPPLAPPSTPVLLKKTEICAVLNISPRALENMVSSGRFPRGVPVGKYVYWSKKVVDDWLRRTFGAQENWRP